MIESTIGIRGKLSADGASGYYLKAGLSYGLDGAGSREYMLSLTTKQSEKCLEAAW